MIETERLVLRPWRDEDRAPFAAMAADAEVMRHLGGPTGRLEADAIIDRQSALIERDGRGFWAVERRADGVLLGICGIRRGGHAGTPVLAELEAGWRFARSAWGQGYAREAAAASIAWGWAHLADERIAAWTVPANASSWGLMLRLGMIHRPELDFNHPAFTPDHMLSRHLVYTIDRPQ
ncbi:GNAT family N-acetyltransferase [Sphingomonas sp. RS2018]